MATLKDIQCTFFGSCNDKSLPAMRSVELVLFGRSNVGKSSLINHAFQNKNLARVAKRPGKTECLNYFTLHEQAYLVDTPGYGFAKRSHKMRDQWAFMMAAYFKERASVICPVILLDARHGPSKEDQSLLHTFAEWHLSPIFVFTKIDKNPKIRTEKQKSEFVASYQKEIEAPLSLHNYPVIFYSIKETKGRHQLKEVLQWAISEKMSLYV